jgi:hypothetical protein
MYLYIQVQSQLPQILLVKELMTALMDSEEAYGECGESVAVICIDACIHSCVYTFMYSYKHVFQLLRQISLLVPVH